MDTFAEAGRNAIRHHLTTALTGKSVPTADVRRVVDGLLRRFITDDLFASTYSFKRTGLSPEQLERLLEQVDRQRPDYLGKIIAMAVEIGKLRLGALRRESRKPRHRGSRARGA